MAFNEKYNGSRWFRVWHEMMGKPQVKCLRDLSVIMHRNALAREDDHDVWRHSHAAFVVVRSCVVLRPVCPLVCLCPWQSKAVILKWFVCIAYNVCRGVRATRSLHEKASRKPVYYLHLGLYSSLNSIATNLISPNSLILLFISY